MLSLVKRDLYEDNKAEDDIAREVKKALASLASDGKIIIINNLHINVAQGGGAKVVIGNESEDHDRSS